MWIEKACHSGHAGETTVDDPFRDFAEDVEDNDDTERGGRIIGQLSWFVQDDPGGFL